MRSIPDQTHLLHAIEHLIIARRELWTFLECEESPFLRDVAIKTDPMIRDLASRLG